MRAKSCSTNDAVAEKRGRDHGLRMPRRGFLMVVVVVVRRADGE